MRLRCREERPPENKHRQWMPAVRSFPVCRKYQRWSYTRQKERSLAFWVYVDLEKITVLGMCDPHPFLFTRSENCQTTKLLYNYGLFLCCGCLGFHEWILGDVDLFWSIGLDTCFGLLFEICPTFARGLNGYFLLIEISIDRHDFEEESPYIEAGESLSVGLSDGVK